MVTTVTFLSPAIRRMSAAWTRIAVGTARVIGIARRFRLATTCLGPEQDVFGVRARVSRRDLGGRLPDALWPGR